MARYNILKSFYASAAWLNFRAAIIAERGLTCEYCGQLIAHEREATVHHIIELTPENVHDVTIALNPENVLVVHGNGLNSENSPRCHDKIHNRFGYSAEKQVYIVYGPPLSGKSTFVQQNMRRGDIIVCMDSLYEAISGLPEYDKPDALLPNVRGVYNLLIDNIKTRYGKWGTAWVIMGGADRYKRERLADELGAELIFCECSKEECLRRLALDEERKYRQDEWRGYIEKWFEEYVA
jgi:hypothetical protein